MQHCFIPKVMFVYVMFAGDRSEGIRLCCNNLFFREFPDKRGKDNGPLHFMLRPIYVGTQLLQIICGMPQYTYICTNNKGGPHRPCQICCAQFRCGNPTTSGWE